MYEVEDKDKTSKDDRPHASTLPERFVLNATPQFNDDGSMVTDLANTAAAKGFVVGAKVKTLKKVGPIPAKGLCSILSVSATEDLIEIQFGEHGTGGAPDVRTTTIDKLQLLTDSEFFGAPKAKNARMDDTAPSADLEHSTQSKPYTCIRKQVEPAQIAYEYMNWSQVNDSTGMGLVESIITSTMLRIALMSGGDPAHINIVEAKLGEEREVHAKIAMAKGVLQLIPYSSKLALQCTTTRD